MRAAARASERETAEARRQRDNKTRFEHPSEAQPPHQEERSGSQRPAPRFHSARRSSRANPRDPLRLDEQPGFDDESTSALRRKSLPPRAGTASGSSSMSDPSVMTSWPWLQLTGELTFSSYSPNRCARLGEEAPSRGARKRGIAQPRASPAMTVAWPSIRLLRFPPCRRSCVQSPSQSVYTMNASAAALLT